MELKKYINMKTYNQYIKELNMWNCPSADKLPPIPERDEYHQDVHEIYDMIRKGSLIRISDDLLNTRIINHLKKYLNDYELMIKKPYKYTNNCYDIYLDSKYNDDEMVERFEFEIRSYKIVSYYTTNDLSKLKVTSSILIDDLNVLDILKEYFQSRPDQTSKYIDIVQQIFPDLDLDYLKKQSDWS